MTSTPREQADNELLKIKVVQNQIQAKRLRLLANKPKPKFKN